MKTFKIEVKKRENTGKASTRRLRAEQNVPCVMYGGDKIFHFYAHENSFTKMIYTHEVFIIEIDIEGDKHKGVIQDIQFHPVTDKIQHIDFVEVFEDKPVIVHIPIELTGSSVGIKNGGKLRQKRRMLKVKGLVTHLPGQLEIDITDVDVGNVVKVGDLHYDNLEILDPHRSMVVSVISSRVALKSATMAEPEAAPVSEEAEIEAEAEAETEEESKEEKTR
jgi:large subunit ribosomal protein L25